MTVREARDQYLAENGFTFEGYDAKWTHASFFGVRFRVPNTDSHRVGIMLHDLHHVATGFGTDLVGEGEISAWEAHRGLAPVGLYVASIVTAGAFMVFCFLRAEPCARGEGPATQGRRSFRSLVFPESSLPFGMKTSFRRASGNCAPCSPSPTKGWPIAHASSTRTPRIGDLADCPIGRSLRREYSS